MSPLLRRPRQRHRIDPRWRGNPARRSVSHLHRLLPWQTVTAGGQVVHEGIGTVAGAALHRGVATMAKLVDVVLDAPDRPRLAHQVRPDLGSDDLIGPAGRAMRNDRAVEV